MKWKSHQLGDRRRISRFAWLPVTVIDPRTHKDEYTVWLEFYDSIEMYAQYYDGVTVWEGWEPYRKELIAGPEKI